jgi:inosine-uridine nucleoside N-ribohydrolase
LTNHQFKKVIIDTDPGVDDAIAILLAFGSPSLQVLGLTTVGGNVPLARATRNALALLEYAGRIDIPVARGSALPVRGRYGYAFPVHGASGLTRRLPNPTIGPISQRAVDFLAQELGKAPGEVLLVALGPLTNLANLTTRHPGSLEQAAGLVVMGGAVDVPGNVTSHAEFNFFSDPEAARMVLSSGIPLTLIDLAATRQVGIEREEAQALQPKNGLATLAVQMLNNWFRRDAGRQRFFFHDPLAMAVALDMGIVTTESAEVAVETVDPVRLGETKISGRPGPVEVVGPVDRDRFFRLFEEFIGSDQGINMDPGGS